MGSQVEAVVDPAPSDLSRHVLPFHCTGYNDCLGSTHHLEYHLGKIHSAVMRYNGMIWNNSTLKLSKVCEGASLSW